jgi:hypothetical protein
MGQQGNKYVIQTVVSEDTKVRKDFTQVLRAERKPSQWKVPKT